VAASAGLGYTPSGYICIVCGANQDARCVWKGVSSILHIWDTLLAPNTGIPKLCRRRHGPHSAWDSPTSPHLLHLSSCILWDRVQEVLDAAYPLSKLKVVGLLSGNRRLDCYTVYVYYSKSGELSIYSRSRNLSPASCRGNEITSFLFMLFMSFSYFLDFLI
jgi:hypothetical protein